MNGPKTTPILELLRALAAALRAQAIYPQGHQMIQTTLKRLEQRLQDLLKEKEVIRVGFIGQDVIAEDAPLLDASALLSGLPRRMEEWGIERLAFHRGIAEEELAAFVRFLAGSPPQDGGDPETQARQAGILHIRLGRLATGTASEEALPLGPEELQGLYGGAIQVYREVLRQHRESDRLHTSLATDLVQNLVRASQTHPDVLSSIAALRNHDDYTFTHAINVGILTVVQARQLGLGERDLQRFGVAALLHDLGKQHIPPEILNKPARLTDEEFDVMKQHPALGAAILHRLGTLGELPALVAFEHHLGTAFKGYPATTRRWSPHLCSHLTTIADAYDALRTNRPYRRGTSIQETLEIMRHSVGTLFEPELFQEFEALMTPLADAETPAS